MSAFLFRRMEKLTKPFLKDFDSGSEFDEAMQSFIQTLAMGLQMYAYTMVMNFLFERGVKIGGALWTYIVAGALKKKIVDKIKDSSFNSWNAVPLILIV